MAVYSMTGYASAQQEATLPAPNGASPAAANSPPMARLGLEIRAVNNRFLDLSLRLPDEFRAHETALRDVVQQRIRRGKLELRVWAEQAAAQALPPPHVQLLQRLGSLQDTIQAWLPSAAGLSVAEVIRLCAAQEQDTGRTESAADRSGELIALAQEALQQLLAARAREGQRLAVMLLERLAQLRTLAGQAKPLIPQLVAQQKKRFLERWQEALDIGQQGVLPEAAQERALSEATAFAIRIDVAEELTRLASHLDEIERLLTQGGELGKRLDFLIQELQREANTLGSKSTALELSQIAMAMKVLIEQMREQVQNIE
ncbi:MAG: YicC/YloC family endoribonuclease [Burkholderiaceae bacterium]